MVPQSRTRVGLVDAKIMQFLKRNRRHGFVAARTIIRATLLSEWTIERRLTDMFKHGVVERKIAIGMFRPSFVYRLKQ